MGLVFSMTMDFHTMDVRKIKHLSKDISQAQIGADNLVVYESVELAVIVIVV